MYVQFEDNPDDYRIPFIDYLSLSLFFLLLSARPFCLISVYECLFYNNIFYTILKTYFESITQIC